MKNILLVCIFFTIVSCTENEMDKVPMSNLEKYGGIHEADVNTLVVMRRELLNELAILLSKVKNETDARGVLPDIQSLSRYSTILKDRISENEMPNLIQENITKSEALLLRESIQRVSEEMVRIESDKKAQLIIEADVMKIVQIVSNS
ncbi:hypothetical protein [Haliea sp. E17]|uniref:hypothetical protein n=1 Tax=Haliea sp. E17 TaxID=3401576 RepID=UPI003AAD01EF